MPDDRPNRRVFFAKAAGALGTGALFPRLSEWQSSEVPNYWVELPPKATLWGTVAFLGDDFIELTMSTPEQSKSVRGRFDGQRLAEYSWRNAGSDMQRVAIRAKAVATNRELPPTGIRFVSEQNHFVGFGRRAMPANASDRRGAYPYDAFLVGFILFGE